jgi:hypothetical protein
LIWDFRFRIVDFYRGHLKSENHNRKSEHSDLTTFKKVVKSNQPFLQITDNYPQCFIEYDSDFFSISPIIVILTKSILASVISIIWKLKG